METRKLPIVDENLRKPAVSNPKKSIAEVILDGSYEKKDLVSIMFSSAFPDNKFAQVEANQYSTAEAMKIFAETITPYLSDAELFSLTNKLIKAEIQLETQAFRTETLTKQFLNIEIERCSKNVAKGQLSPVLLYHLDKYIFPLIKKTGGRTLMKM